MAGVSPPQKLARHLAGSAAHLPAFRDRLPRKHEQGVGLPEFLRLRSIRFQSLACVAFLRLIQGM